MTLIAPRLEESQARPGPFKNRILTRIPERELLRWVPYLQRKPFEAGDTFQATREPIEYVQFIESGLVSIVATTPSGGTIEVVPVGNEGVIGSQIVAGGATNDLEVVGQVAGTLVQLARSTVRAHIYHCPATLLELLAFKHCLFVAASYNSACTATHTPLQWLARRLLTVADRAQTDEFYFTHESMAHMLNVGRPTLSVAANELASRGLIRYRRGLIRITDRAGLVDATCSCYRAIYEAYDERLKRGGAP